MKRLLSGVACLLLWSGAARSGEVLVAAASDLKFALDEVVAQFQRDSSHTARVTYGSSGTFATQIRNGAPFQLYLSADESYVKDLAKDGLARNEGALYAIGRIVLLVPNGSPLTADGQLGDLRRKLAAGAVKRFAIANPDHAPYGVRAQEALTHAGLWESIRTRLVLGENVSQAAQFAISGSAQGGIVALSLVLAPDMQGRATYAVIPEAWHAPLRQRMVLLKTAGEPAQALYDYLQQPRAREIMRKYGFALPAAR